MFCSEWRRRVADLEGQLKEASARAEAMGAELAALQAARSREQADRGELDRELHKCRQIYRTLDSFGKSFLALQASQASAAASMKDEQRHAAEAATASSDNRQAMDAIAAIAIALSSCIGPRRPTNRPEFSP
jgi:chromosome segregation ATPase